MRWTAAIAFVGVFLLGVYASSALLVVLSGFKDRAADAILRIRCPASCVFERPREPFFLMAFLSLRIYRQDRSNLTTSELVQWLQAMRFAGVQKVALYDSYSAPAERQLNALKPFIDDGFVDYTDWSDRNPYGAAHTQVAAYSDACRKYCSKTRFYVTFDIDEYAAVPGQMGEKGYLAREIDRIASSSSNVGLIVLENYIFVAENASVTRNQLLIDRSHLRTDTTLQWTVKYVALAAAVGKEAIHRPTLREGFVAVSDPTRLYLAHYWIGRGDRHVREKSASPNEDCGPLRDWLTTCSGVRLLLFFFLFFFSHVLNRRVREGSMRGRRGRTGTRTTRPRAACAGSSSPTSCAPATATTVSK
jgi:hypothetical protein